MSKSETKTRRTPTETLVGIVGALQEYAGYSDRDIKFILEESGVFLPEAFPKKWGGKEKSKTDVKRALTAYETYLADKDARGRFYESFEKGKSKKVMSAAYTARWKDLDPEIKNPYYEKSGTLPPVGKKEKAENPR